MERIETVGDLIAARECYDPGTSIRRASQPGWPFEYTLGGVALTSDDAEHNGTAFTDEPVVWIGKAARSGTCPASPPTPSGGRDDRTQRQRRADPPRAQPGEGG